jgi:hypothetical protein
MSSFSVSVNLVTFLGRRPLALKLSRMPPMCNAFHWHILQHMKLRRWLTMDRLGVHNYWTVYSGKISILQTILYHSRKSEKNTVTMCHVHLYDVIFLAR